ncbi:MAG: NAD(P)H-dependent oxidoreductase [Pseudomonadota bacterium]
MSTVPILNGQQPHPVAKGTLNATMVARTTAHLEALGQSVRVTRIEEGYDVDAQIASHPWAETVIMQFPVNWIGVPWPFKKCVDEVHTAGLDGRLCEGDGRTAEAPKANCGLGGTLTGRHSMPSVTLSAPEAAFASPQEPFFEGPGSTICSGRCISTPPPR